MARGDQWVAPARRGGGARRGRSSGVAARRAIVVVLLVVLVLGIGSIIQLLRGVPNPTYRPVLAEVGRVAGGAPQVNWPSGAESAAEILGVGYLGEHGGTRETEIASVAKMTTALLTVKAHPLSLGEPGPELTMTPADYQIYQQDVAAGDSVGKIAEGEKLSEYQLLELLLIPSADNIATVLARWDAGSVTAFVAQMNSFAAGLGLHHTHYGDPSGLTSATLSIPRDQLKIESLFMANPVLAYIASKPQATLPVAGTVYNVDYALGHAHIVGAKTGSITTGNFAMATQFQVDGRQVYGLGVVLDAGGVQPLINALHDGEQLARSLQTIPRAVQVLRKGEVVGDLEIPGSTPDPIVATKTIDDLGWGGLSESFAPTLNKGSLYGLKAGQQVGTLTVTVGQQLEIVPLRIEHAVTKPSVLYRLTHL